MRTWVRAVSRTTNGRKEDGIILPQDAGRTYKAHAMPCRPVIFWGNNIIRKTSKLAGIDMTASSKSRVEGIAKRRL